MSGAKTVNSENISRKQSFKFDSGAAISYDPFSLGLGQSFKSFVLQESSNRGSISKRRRIPMNLAQVIRLDM